MSATYRGKPVIRRKERAMFSDTDLSDREIDVAELTASGMSNKDVAAKLFITEKTTKFHLTNVYKKLNIKSRAQLCVLGAKYRYPIEETAVDVLAEPAPMKSHLPEGNA